jgi:CubicO group peptidase (beta-lactamase class C family)
MRYPTCLFLVLCISAGIVRAEGQVNGLATDLAGQKINQIFSDYNKPGSPGCSLGVIRDGDFVYRKAYGQASLELGVPLSSQSVFYMASVSKQFTAASVVLAAAEGSCPMPTFWPASTVFLPIIPVTGERTTV